MWLALCASALAGWPMSGTSDADPLQDPFGPRTLRGTYDFHRGLDMPGRLGDPVHAVAAGTVVRTGTEAFEWDGPLESFGNWVLVEHEPLQDGTPVHTSYLHLDTIDTEIGAWLEPGGVLGTVDHSGRGIQTTHLHLNLYYGLEGSWIDKERSVSPHRMLPRHGPVDYRLELIDPTSVRFGALAPNVDLVRLEVRGSDASATYDLERNTIDFETEEGVCGDLPDCDGATLVPHHFHVGTSWALWDVTFHDTGPLTRACLYSVEGLVRSFGEGCPEAGVERDPEGEIARTCSALGPGASWLWLGGLLLVVGRRPRS